MNTHKYFIERLTVRLAEALEIEIIRTCFIAGDITDQVKPDIAWAKNTLEAAAEETKEELTIDNVTEYSMLLEDMLMLKLQQELHKELGEVGANLPIPASAIEGEVMFAIQSARNDAQALDATNVNH